MAFMLKSVKVVHSRYINSVRVLIGKRKEYLLKGSSVYFNESLVRTAVSFAAEEVKEKDNVNFQRSCFELVEVMRNRNIFIEDAKEVFQAIKDKGEITYSQIMLLLKCCSQVSFMSSKEERIKLAEEIWLTVRNFGTEYHISHYNALLNVFLENDHKFSPSEFLTILETDGLEPNLVTYRRLLKAYCQQGDIKGANDMLEKMKELNYPLSDDEFNSLILGYSEVGDFEKAAGIIKVMQEKDIEPTSKSYTYLLCGYAKHGQIEKMNQLLEELPKQDVFLSDPNLFEIMYTLAVNKQEQHVDGILQRLSSTATSDRHLNTIIQRLLHDKLDSVALKIFEGTYTSEHSMRYVLNNSQFLIRHFVLYRNHDEILDLCQKLEEKGLAKASLSYILKLIFLLKDENFCLDLFNVMIKRNMEMRSHYFWPVIIKASKKGNPQMFEVLKRIPQELLRGNKLTLTKIIFPNYKFGENWRTDYETLSQMQLNRAALTMCFLEKLLMEKKFDAVEDVVSTFPVIHPTSILYILMKKFADSPNENERCVNIIYFLEHDHHLLLTKNRELENERTEEANKEEVDAEDPRTEKSLFDVAVVHLTHLITDENVTLRFLQNMLEKKMGITPKTASFVVRLLSNEEIADVANKLANQKFVFDENVLQKKSHYILNMVNRKRLLEVCSDNLTSDREANAKVLMQEVKSVTSLENFMKLLQFLIHRDKSYEAVKLAEQLHHRKDFISDRKAKKLYLNFVLQLHKRGHIDLGEEAYNLGESLGFLHNKDIIALVRLLFLEGNISEAIDTYGTFIRKLKRVSGGMEFLMRTVAGGTDEQISKLTSFMCDHMPEYICLTNLALALAANGQVERAKNLLDVKKLKMDEKRLYSFCEVNYTRSSSNVFNNFLNFVKDIEYFDRVPLYKLLIRKYADEGELEKAKQLWLLVEEDNISDYDFLEKMGEFINNPTMEELKSLADTFGIVHSSGPADEINEWEEASYADKKLKKAKDLDRAFAVACAGDTPIHAVENLVNALASEGKVSEVLRLLELYELNLSSVAKTFLNAKKGNEYLMFLKHYADNGNFEAIRNCFIIHNFQRFLLNDELFSQYKSLAVLCCDNKVIEPLISYFVNCLNDNKIKEAEEIFEGYPDVFSSVPFSKMRPLITQIYFYSNLISSSKLKSHFSDSLPLIYSELIRLSCSSNTLKMALNVLERAVAEGVENEIDKGAISLLEKKLVKTGKTFPYPKLLRLET